jgi:HNH endonuclease
MTKLCSVEGCGNPVRSKGLCGKHYERVRAHGDVNADFRSGRKVIPRICSVPNCEEIAIHHHKDMKICPAHYHRWRRNGSFDPVNSPYGAGVIHKQGYRRIHVNGQYKMEHVVLAEKALGRPLPKGAVVHHMNEIPDDNFTPFNLVICPDQEYHFLLHKRAKELEKYGKCLSLGNLSTQGD